MTSLSSHLKPALVVFLILISQFATAQIVSGKIIDSLSSLPVPFANIFLNNATQAVYSDENGSFSLKGTKPGQYQLVISCVGYERYLATILVGKSPINVTIKLKPANVALREVAVKPQSSSERRKLLRMFFDAFVGKSENASSCSFINPDCLVLNYDSKERVLEAYAESFLKLRNDALGYQLNILLDGFAVDYKTNLITYKGQFFFQELKGKTRLQKNWKQNRQEAYRGSMRQFYKSLYQKKLQANGFIVHPILTQKDTLRPPQSLINQKLALFASDRDSLNYWQQVNSTPVYRHQIVTDVFLKEDSLIRPASQPGLFEFSFDQHLYLLSKYRKVRSFRGISSASTILTLTGEKVLFDLNGVAINQGDIIYEGPAIEKIADLLPFDYAPSKEDELYTQLPEIKSEQTSKMSQYYFEKAYVRTDRELYNKEDHVFFSTYLVNASSNNLNSFSKTLYVDLISPEQKVLFHHLIRIENGLGNGDFEIPEYAPSGLYTIRAYTNWMRNFGDNFIFEKKIQVSDLKHAVIGKGEASRAIPAQEAIAVSEKNVDRRGDIQPTFIFFPEGGSLVVNVLSRVAVKACDSSGRAYKCRAVIVNSKGDSLAGVETNAKGTGSFMLRPQSGELYFARAYKSDEKSQTQLPKALEQGLSMFVQEKDSLYNVYISTNSATLGKVGKLAARLQLRNGPALLATRDLNLNKEQLVVRIKKTLTRPGVNVLTLYDDQNRPQAERLLFSEPRDSVALSIDVVTRPEKRGERAEVALRLTKVAPNLTSNVSVSVIAGGFGSAARQNIKSYLLLQSEIKAEIEDPSQYFDAANGKRFEELDLLMLTLGWRDYLWKHVEDSLQAIRFVAEQGISLDGSVSAGGVPVSGANVGVYLPEVQKVFGTRTDSSGQFYFKDLVFYDTKEAVISSIDAAGKPLGVISVKERKADTLAVNTISGSSMQKLSKPELFLSDVQHLAGKSGFGDTIRLKAVNIRARKTLSLLEGTAVDFGYPEENFRITAKEHDYRDLRHFLLRQSRYATEDSPSIIYVCGGDSHSDNLGCSHPPVVAKRAGTCSCGSELQEVLTGSNNRVMFRGADSLVMPQIFVNQRQLSLLESDNQAYKNTVYLDYLNLPINLIESVKVKKVMMTSLSGNPGPAYLLYLNLVPGALLPKEENKAVKILNGYYRAKVFYEEKVKSAVNIRDKRITLYWKPSSTIVAGKNTKIEFLTSDLRGKVTIIAEGISNTGVPLFGSAEFELK